MPLLKTHLNHSLLPLDSELGSDHSFVYRRRVQNLTQEEMVCILQDVQDFVMYIERNLETIHRSICIGVYPKDARLRMIEYSTLSD